MKLVDKAVREFWEKADDLKQYRHEYSAEIAGNKLVITPHPEYSEISILQRRNGVTNLRGQLKPFVVDLGNQSIEATLTERLTHDDIKRLMEIALTEQLKGHVNYKMPLSFVSLSELPEEFSKSVDSFHISDGQSLTYSPILSYGKMTTKPECTFYDKLKEQEILKLPFVKKLDKTSVSSVIVPSRAPTLKEIQGTAFEFSEKPVVDLIILNPTKTLISEVPANPFDSSLTKVEGDLGEAYSIRHSGHSSYITIRPPFEKTVEPLEDAFERRLIYEED